MWKKVQHSLSITKKSTRQEIIKEQNGWHSRRPLGCEKRKMKNKNHNYQHINHIIHCYLMQLNILYSNNKRANMWIGVCVFRFYVEHHSPIMNNKYGRNKNKIVCNSFLECEWSLHVMQTNGCVLICKSSRNRNNHMPVPTPFFSIIFFLTRLCSIWCPDSGKHAQRSRNIVCKERRNMLTGQCHVTWKQRLRTIFIVIACSR